MVFFITNQDPHFITTRSESLNWHGLLVGVVRTARTRWYRRESNIPCLVCHGFKLPNFVIKPEALWAHDRQLSIYSYPHHSKKTTSNMTVVHSPEARRNLERTPLSHYCLQVISNHSLLAIRKGPSRWYAGYQSSIATDNRLCLSG